MDTTMHSQNSIELLMNHPKASAFITGLSYFVSIKIPVLMGFISIFEDNHVKPMIIEFFQIGGYATTMLVGVFTVMSYVKSWNKDKNKPNSN